MRLWLPICTVISLAVISFAQSNTNDTPFIPRPTLYSTTLNTYFKIDFVESLNFIVNTGSNRFSVVQGATSSYGSSEKYDIYYRKGDSFVYAVPQEKQEHPCYKFDRPFPKFTLDILEDWWRVPEDVTYEGEQVALYTNENCNVWSKNRSDKRVQLFINEVSSSPVQIIEQHPYAKPEWRIVNTFHEFNTSLSNEEPSPPKVDLSSCVVPSFSLASLLPEALLEVQQ